MPLLRFAFFVVFIGSARMEDAFKRLDPRFLQLGRPVPCDRVTVRIQASPSATHCALLCSLDAKCRAFLHRPSDARCSILAAACRPLFPEDQQRLMVRIREPPTGLIWRYHGSRLLVPKAVKLDFRQAEEACADYGMHLWVADSEKEWLFFVQIAQSVKTFAHSGLWVGAVDRPNGHCLLPDRESECPVTMYHPGEPSNKFAECTQAIVKWMAWGWDDVTCHLKSFAVCEGRY